MLCILIGILIFTAIGFFLCRVIGDEDVELSLLTGVVLGLSLGTFAGACTGALIEDIAPTTIREYSETYELSPIEENLYVASDSNNLIVRQNDKLTEISRDIVKTENSKTPEIIYFYEEQGYTNPWKTLIAPIVESPRTDLKSVIIKAPMKGEN